MAGGLVGVWIGSLLVLKVKVRGLQIALSIVLLVAAARLIFLSLEDSASDVPELATAVVLGYVAAGFVTGLFFSFLGVGGGLVVVPLLVTFFGFSQQLAQGTSLVVIVPIALLGAWRLTKSGFTHWGQGVRIGVAAAVFAAIQSVRKAIR